MNNVVNLVADIGGTNLRIGQALPDGETESLVVYQCKDYPSLESIVADYIEKFKLENSEINACFAIACPVDKDLIKLTNLPWQFSKSALKTTFGFRKLLLINDYTAIAHAVPHLAEHQKVKIGDGEAVENYPISICGPGTGLGVANLFPVDGQWVSVGGEGGHVDFAPIDIQEIKILEKLLEKYEHVSYEQLLSGLGIEQIYHAICQINDIEPKFDTAKDITAKDITAKALANECDYCVQTLAQFCKTLGSFAGNLSLTMSSFGGVYIAGGIVPRFIEYLKNSDFRNRFEQKGRFTRFNQAIPTYVITESQPGILGASAYLRQHNKEES
ncbi:glucokinase [Thalassotalea fusca]